MRTNVSENVLFKHAEYAVHAESMPRIVIIQKEHVQINNHVQKESCSEKYAENTVNSKLQNSILNLEVLIKISDLMQRF